MQYVLRRLGIGSAAKVSALLHGILLFLIGLVYGGILIILSLVNFASGGVDLTSGGISLALSLLSLIGLPIGGLIYGALLGAVIAIIYDFIADFTGGIEIGIDEKPERPAPAQKKGK